MKKVITIIGIFGLIFVQAQVGINQDEPKATLDIKAEKTDGSQVEGLLVPRISKEAVFNMATAPTQLQESNMVYVNNANYTFPAGATVAQKATVADITEKGYYFWNGAKWVKTVGKDGAEWVYEGDSIRLKRSGEGTFKNKVYYDKNGNFINTSSELKDNYEWPFSGKKVARPMARRFMSSNSSELPQNPGAPNVHSSTRLYLNPQDTALYNINNVRNVIRDSLSVNTGRIYGDVSVYNKSGTGRVGYAAAHYSNAVIYKGLARTLTSSQHNTSIGGDAKVDNANNIDAYGYIDTGANGAVGTFNSINNTIAVKQTDSIGVIKGVYTTLQGVSGGGVSNIGTLIGYSYGQYRNGANVTLKNEYGIHLANVNQGTEKNYAIYTNAGKVRFGDTLYINKGEHWTWTADEKAKRHRELILFNSEPMPLPGDYAYRITTNIDAAVGGERKDKYRGHSIDFGYNSFDVSTNPFIAFRVSPEQGNPTNKDMTEERMRITSSGRVGIGTNAPATKLDVNGAIKVGSNSEASGVPTHTAPNGTIIYHNDSFYGKTSNGWKKLHN